MTQKIIWEPSLEGASLQRLLEEGNLLFFPQIPFEFPQEESDFLLSQKQTGKKSRKNIAYKKESDQVSNHQSGNSFEKERLKETLRHYAERSSAFLSRLLPNYAKYWKLDYTSLRPFQEKARKLRLRARNDLLHVDAFPTRPLHGARILRFFTNINPIQARHWVTSETVDRLIERFAGKGVEVPHSVGFGVFARLRKRVQKFLQDSGWKAAVRSPYDVFMLKLHHFLKENGEFQKECPKDHWLFPPQSCWAVFTDQVSHAALEGQYALEQTFIVPKEALVFPDRSPIAILERLSGRNLVDPDFSVFR